MNRERSLLLGSLLFLFVALTSVLVWSQVFTSQQFFEAGTKPTPQAKEIEPRLPILRSSDPVRGSSDPKAVTIVEFADFSCQYCRLTYQELKKTFVSTATPIRFVWRTFPVNLQNPQATLLASAGYCAQQQNKFWEVYDRLFTIINPTSESVSKLAKEAGLESSAFDRCLTSSDRLKGLQGEVDIASASRITGAPTIFVGKQVFNGFVSAEELRAAIDQEYKK